MVSACAPEHTTAQQHPLISLSLSSSSSLLLFLADEGEISLNLKSLSNIGLSWYIVGDVREREKEREKERRERRKARERESGDGVRGRAPGFGFRFGFRFRGFGFRGFVLVVVVGREGRETRSSARRSACWLSQQWRCHGQDLCLDCRHGELASV